MQMIGFLSFLFVGLTLINRVMEGQFLASAEVAVLNNIMVFRELSVAGMFTIPIPNMSFITEGLPALVRWDYSFFGGNAVIIKYFLYSLTAGLTFLVFSMIIGLLYQYFGRRP